MKTFPLKIVTPYGSVFDGEVEELVVRTVTGDMGILAGHISCVAPLGMGRATLIIDGKKRYAACIGGMLSVVNGHATLVPSTFEWSEDIDQERAEESYRKAKEIMDSKTASGQELRLAEARLRRALVRKGVAGIK